jgi:hypothetical protein
MSEAGFDYLPYIVDTSTYFSESDPALHPRLFDRDWVAQYGWGFISSPYQDWIRDHPPVVEVDPNTDYRASLTPGAAVAYYQALYVPSAMIEGNEYLGTSQETYEWQDFGCVGAAQHQVQGDNPKTSSEFDPILEEVSEFNSRPPSAKILRLNTLWSDCMADKGYSAVTDPGSARYVFMNEVLGPVEAGLDLGIGESPLDRPEVLALVDEEVAMALAAFDCGTVTNYDAIAWQDEFDAQEQFIADHKAELEAYRLAAEQWPW